MSIITSETYYRSAQIASILLFPALLLMLIFLQIEDRIVVDGVVEAGQHAVLTSPLEKTLIKKILVSAGDNVTCGQPLVIFDDLHGWGHELGKKRPRLQFLEQRAVSIEKLNSQGAISSLQAKEARLEATTLRVEIASLEENLARLTFSAPFTGRITSIIAKPFQKVEIGSELIALSAMKLKVIRCKVPEDRFASLQKGQPVAIKSKLFNYLRYDIYHGSVASFDAYGARDAGKLSFESVIRLNKEAENALKVGTTARCEIITDRRPLYQLLMKGR